MSDLHLSPNNIPATKDFIKLLNKFQLEKIYALYILGDFFDYWLGDDDDSEFIRTIKNSLYKLSKYTTIYYIRGNHDFAIGDKFALETNIKLLHDCSTINVANNTILLSHGDIFCTLDTTYQKFKKIIQNKYILYILKKMPLTWRRKLKNRLEHSASSQFNTKDQKIYHVVDTTILEYTKKYQANIVIHGHTHNPGVYVLTNTPTITRIEIPDWDKHPTQSYVLFDTHSNTVSIKYGYHQE